MKWQASCRPPPVLELAQIAASSSCRLQASLSPGRAPWAPHIVNLRGLHELSVQLLHFHLRGVRRKAGQRW